MINLTTTSKFVSLLWLIGYLTLFSAHATEINESNFEWQKAKEKNGILVQTRQTNSGYKEIKASIEVTASPFAFLSLLDNVEIASEWIDNCQQVEILETPSEQQKIVHTRFAAPWPVRDRDMVTLSKTTIDEANNRVLIEVSDMSEHYPESSDMVRMQQVRGIWHLQQTARGTTQITYQGYGEPSGNMPRWLANKLVVGSIYTTFNKMRKQLEKQE